MARAIPRKHLEQIGATDPAHIDRAVLEAAGVALSVRSDNADPIALVYYERDGRVRGYDVYGDTTAFPAVEVKSKNAGELPGA